MGKKTYVRVRIELAREAYEIAANPDISMLHYFAQKYGTPDPYENTHDPDVPTLTSTRITLIQRGIDYKYILLNFCNELAQQHGVKRAERLINWLQPGGNITNSSLHRQRAELKQDLKRLATILCTYERE